jgi:8-oxo-dGTP diphosphatase
MDRDHRVLLVHFDFVDEERPTGFWACPGGGIDPGESTEEGLVRELAEELGLVVSEPGPPIWSKEHIFAMNRWDGQHDTYFLVEVDGFEPRPAFTEAELRAEHVDGVRWWGYAELLAAQLVYDSGDLTAPGYTVFSPRRLGHLVRDIVERGRPRTLLQVDPP